MPTGDLSELASYLLSCSVTSLGSAYLQRLDRAAHLERNLRGLLREFVETQAMAELAGFLLNYGEGIMASSAARALATEPRSATSERRPWPITASNFYPVQDASDRSAPRGFLDSYEKLVCWAILRSANSEGWATLTQAVIGDRASVTGGRAKAILRRLRQRGVIENGHINLRGARAVGAQKGQSHCYRIRPTGEWTEPRQPRLNKGPKPSPKRAVLTLHLGDKGARMWVPGTPEQTVGRGTVISIGDRDGVKVAIHPVPGPVELRYPVGSIVKLPRDLASSGAASIPGTRTGYVGNPTPSNGSAKIELEKRRKIEARDRRERFEWTAARGANIGSAPEVSSHEVQCRTCHEGFVSSGGLKVHRCAGEPSSTQTQLDALEIECRRSKPAKALTAAAGP